MLHIHRAERADALVEALGSLLADPLPDPFSQELVLVTAKGVERWLSQRLSHRLGHAEGREDGVCAGVEFRSPASLVAELVVQGAGAREDDPWSPDWVCYYFINDSVPPSFVVDVSDYYERKRAALECHASQFQRTAPDAAETRLNTPLFRQLIESRDAQFGALAGVRPDDLAAGRPLAQCQPGDDHREDHLDLQHEGRLDGSLPAYLRLVEAKISFITTRLFGVACSMMRCIRVKSSFNLPARFLIPSSESKCVKNRSTRKTRASLPGTG